MVWVHGLSSRRPGVGPLQIIDEGPGRFRVNMAQLRQTRPDSVPRFQMIIRKKFQVVPSSLGSGLAALFSVERLYRGENRAVTQGSATPHPTFLLSRAKMARIRQSGTDSRLGVQVKVLKTVWFVPASLGSNLTTGR